MTYHKIHDESSWSTVWKNVTRSINELEKEGFEIISAQPYGGGSSSAGVCILYRDKPTEIKKTL